MAEIDEFLGSDEPEVEPPVAEAAVVDPVVAETEAKTADATEPEPEDVVGLRSALQAERAKRKDYKGERDRLAGELDAYKARVEAFEKAPKSEPAPSEPIVRQQAAIPNPVEDPQGYHAFIQQDIFNRSLNMSEAMLRQQIGDDADVDAKVALFRKMADANPALRVELQNSAHPYRYAYDTAAKTQALEEIGDPASYRTKIEAELRAKIEAEYAAGTVQQNTPVPPRVQLPQSLGTARSAGARSMSVINVPDSLEEILSVGKR